MYSVFCAPSAGPSGGQVRHHGRACGAATERQHNTVRRRVGFHTGSVIALSVATRRTLLATASDDNTVRVWDYHRQSCRAVHQASQPVAAVALHPWGTDLIVAHREFAFTYVVAGSELVRGQRLPESAAGADAHAHSWMHTLVLVRHVNVLWPLSVYEKPMNCVLERDCVIAIPSSGEAALEFDQNDLGHSPCITALA